MPSRKMRGVNQLWATVLVCSCTPNREYLREKTALTIFGPLVLATDLFLLLRGEVVGNVESFSDLVWRLALDHVGDCLAPDIKKWLDI
jgi:hypothetical protein